MPEVFPSWPIESTHFEFGLRYIGYLAGLSLQHSRRAYHGLTFHVPAQEAMTMTWEIHEKAEDKDGVKEWSLFIVMKGEQPSNSMGSPLKKGYWFFGKDGGDPAGHGLYIEGLREAEAEVERLNRLSVSPGR